MPRGTKEQPGEFNNAVTQLILRAYETRKRTHGLTQKDLAIAAQVSRPQMVRLLGGQKHWTVDEVERVCRLLNINLVETVQEAESMTRRFSNVSSINKNVNLETVDLNHFDKAANNHKDEGEPI